MTIDIEPLHSPDGEKRGGADATRLGGAAGDAGRYVAEIKKI